MYAKQYTLRAVKNDEYMLYFQSIDKALDTLGYIAHYIYVIGLFFLVVFGIVLFIFKSVSGDARHPYSTFGYPCCIGRTIEVDESTGHYGW